MRRVLRLAGLGLALVAAYLLASVLGALIPGGGPDLSGPQSQTIGLIHGPIHTDILLPLSPEIRSQFGFAEAAGVPLNDARAAWLLVGWGSQAFYTTAGSYSDITASAAFTAATGDAAVLRLDALGPLPDLPTLTFLPLSDQQFQRLVTVIDATFTRDATGRVLALNQPGFTATDAFFPATGNFNIFHTCNVWLGETLRSAGIAFGIWTPAPWSVRLSLWWHQGGQSG